MNFLVRQVEQHYVPKYICFYARFPDHFDNLILSHAVTKKDALADLYNELYGNYRALHIVTYLMSFIVKTEHDLPKLQFLADEFSVPIESFIYHVNDGIWSEIMRKLNPQRFRKLLTELTFDLDEFLESKTSISLHNQLIVRNINIIEMDRSAQTIRLGKNDLANMAKAKDQRRGKYHNDDSVSER